VPHPVATARRTLSIGLTWIPTLGNNPLIVASQIHCALANCLTVSQHAGVGSSFSFHDSSKLATCSGVAGMVWFKSTILLEYSNSGPQDPKRAGELLMQLNCWAEADTTAQSRSTTVEDVRSIFVRDQDFRAISRPQNE